MEFHKQIGSYQMHGDQVEREHGGGPAVRLLGAQSHDLTLCFVDI